jgi:acetyltransferase-like isoleucine patch superfamily enzyme
MSTATTSFLGTDELRDFGFQSLGRGVKISRRASIYGASRISIGDYSRIDDFVVISAGVEGILIGRNVHVAAFCGLFGNGRIELGDFSGLSSRATVYSSSDDYSGAYMTNPTVPVEYTNVASAPVRVGRGVIIGANSLILPGVESGAYSAVGAGSVIRKNCEPGHIYAGNPARVLKRRHQALQELERRFLEAGDR